MSVLKSLAYSADGSFNGMWCTPSRLNGEKMSPFCTAMCAYSMRCISPDLAKQCLMSALDLQDEKRIYSKLGNTRFQGRKHRTADTCVSNITAFQVTGRHFNFVRKL
ncbi:MAG: hypothetical protein L6V93_18155 [Clostridiales bacterium]|nr:MAG: hypothetical protein L6V93_18155 [Clostridiales bacterium]